MKELVKSRKTQYVVVHEFKEAFDSKDTRKIQSLLADTVYSRKEFNIKKDVLRLGKQSFLKKYVKAMEYTAGCRAYDDSHKLRAACAMLNQEYSAFGLCSTFAFADQVSICYRAEPDLSLLVGNCIAFGCDIWESNGALFVVSTDEWCRPTHLREIVGAVKHRTDETVSRFALNRKKKRQIAKWQKNHRPIGSRINYLMGLLSKIPIDMWLYAGLRDDISRGKINIEELADDDWGKWGIKPEEFDREEIPDGFDISVLDYM